MRSRRRNLVVSVVVGVLVLGLLAAMPGTAEGTNRRKRDTARYILPPGNYGGLPTTDESRDQLAMYDGLTPLRGNVTDADIDSHYLPENFEPLGQTTEIQTGRPGLRLLYDEYGVAHVYGRTRADLAFGAGWVTARDRTLLLLLGRGPARAAVADVPGIDAFSLVTSGQSFVPSAATEALLDDQVELLKKTYGAKGRTIIKDAQAEADGMNAWAAATNYPDWVPATVNDVIAVTAFIGSIFGSGGGAEATNADLLARLQDGMGEAKGRAAFQDAMLFDDPEAPVTSDEHVDYGQFTGGPVTGSVQIDAGSIVPLDPRQAPAGANLAAEDGIVDAAAAPPRKQASNFLVVDPSRSATGNGVAVMGPQLGYYYPEIVQQIHLSGPGIEAQGVAVPGMAMYILIGRTKDYAWSLTSAGHDVRDVFAEQLCEPDGSAPTRDSDHYVFNGECQPFEQFDAGTLNGTPIVYPRSVHGPKIGTATVDGKPFALTSQRSTFGRDGLNLAALKDMTDGKAKTAPRFFDAANRFGFTFNWAYVSRDAGTAYFSSGLLPKRAPGLDRALPTLGTGGYEWQGFLSEGEHVRDSTPPDGLFLNWNNQSAHGFMHGDDEPNGSVHRVELFDKFAPQVTLAGDVSVMNRAATEDVRSPVWPVVSQVLRTGAAPNALDARALDVLDAWVAADAPRLDADNNGKNDDAGAPIMDAVWRPIAEAVMRPVYGNLLGALNNVRNLGGLSGESFVDKDLRYLLDPSSVEGPFNLRYCGNGDLDACRQSLWAAFDQAVAGLATTQGTDPTQWRGNASRSSFVPGLIPDTFRATNRPTFQQVLEFVNH
jgi:acyl-homoserine lactone acylase PvdQ